MNTTNTQNKTEQNYQLIIIDRYDIADSKVVVVTEEFIEKFEEMLTNQTGARTASVGSDYEGLDDEEQSFLWSRTDKKLDAESQEFMSDYEFEDEDEE